MTKYLSRWQEIERVEVERETESSVWVRGRVQRKMTDYECYHDTFEQAKAHIVRCAQKGVDDAKRQLAYEEGKLARAQAAKMP